MTASEAELQERILQEKRLVALEVQTEAWADGISEGVDPEIMAMAGMETILGHLVRECGPETARSLLAAMKEQLETGLFQSHGMLN